MEILFGVALVFLILIALRLLFLERRLRRVFGSAKNADVVGAVANHAETLTRLEGELGRIVKSHALLSKNVEASVQKVSMIRFNPFSDSGGDQSFSIALLDGQDNGFVLSGLYVQDRPMVYAKPIQHGRSRYALSAEEESVLAKAKDSVL